MITSCNSHWGYLSVNSGTPPGGLLGTADACPEPLPYQDPSARQFATLLMLTICVSAPIFQLQSAAQSVYVSPTLAFSPKKDLQHQTKSPSRNTVGRIFISRESRLAACSCLWNICVADQSPLWCWQKPRAMTRPIMCLRLLATAGPVNLNIFNPGADTINELYKKNPPHKQPD